MLVAVAQLLGLAWVSSLSQSRHACSQMQEHIVLLAGQEWQVEAPRLQLVQITVWRKVAGVSVSAVHTESELLVSSSLA